MLFTVACCLKFRCIEKVHTLTQGVLRSNCLMPKINAKRFLIRFGNNACDQYSGKRKGLFCKLFMIPIIPENKCARTNLYIFSFAVNGDGSVTAGNNGTGNTGL